MDAKGKGKFGDTTKGKTDTTTKGFHKGSSGDDTGSTDVVSKGHAKGNSNVTETNQGLEDGKGIGKFGDTTKGKTDTTKGSHKGTFGDDAGSSDGVSKGAGKFKGKPPVTKTNQGFVDAKGKSKFGDTTKGKTDTTKGSHKGSYGDDAGSTDGVSKGAGKFKGKPIVTETNQGFVDAKRKGKFGDTTKGKTDTTAKGFHKGYSGDDTGSTDVVSKGCWQAKGQSRCH